MGIIITLGSEVAVALLLWIGLAVAGVDVKEHLRWFGACFIPPVLLLRHYVKQKSSPAMTKTIIITLFVTFVLYMFLMIRLQPLTFNP